MFSGGATSMGVNTGFPFDPDNLVLVALWRKPAVRPLRRLGRHTNIDRRLLECRLGGCRVRFRGPGPSIPLHQLDRKSGASGKRVSARLDLGGRLRIKKKQ